MVNPATFDESLWLNELRRRVFGSYHPGGIFTLTFDTHRFDSISTQLRLQLDIDRHHILVDDQPVPRKASRWVCRASVADHDVAFFRGPLNVIRDSAINDLIAALSTEVREFDPRVGVTDRPPPFPLFDPVERIPDPESVPCTVCQMGGELIWGGANLMWVHADCWRQIYKVPLK